MTTFKSIEDFLSESKILFYDIVDLKLRKIKEEKEKFSELREKYRAFKIELTNTYDFLKNKNLSSEDEQYFYAIQDLYTNSSLISINMFSIKNIDDIMDCLAEFQNIALLWLSITRK